MPRTRSKPPNPTSAAVHEWFDSHSPQVSVLTTDVDTLVAEAPKRWVTYEPMVLLPSGSFTSPTWQNVLSAVPPDCSNVLWETVLRHIGDKTREKVTHLAANDGIPLTVATQPAAAERCAQSSPKEQQQHENVLRSPIGLRILHGDFGPPETPGRTVTGDDFDRAFWASTKQNGIHQTWAPRWTMFSRGNIKEKARLLAFHDAPGPSGDGALQLAHRVLPRTMLSKSWAVDLYAGIGYFVFSYARLGMRVLCWELNPWSVEGLRRGARHNGWPVKIVQGPDLTRPTHELVSDGDRIVVFLENNAEAARRVQELRSRGGDLPVRHVNCGLLPRSDDSWEAARAILGRAEDGWLHLHENVGVNDIANRRDEIQGLFDEWDGRDGAERAAKVEDVELVKTFAPDVWHCVFDVYNYKV